mmetsp:Transcript_494/g.975  ORF Transcript_494/g.975 Transcript_494/m.975 type:complete len:241 (-) Transcript_494:410-1132(-)
MAFPRREYPSGGIETTFHIIELTYRQVGRMARRRTEGRGVGCHEFGSAADDAKGRARNGLPVGDSGGDGGVVVAGEADRSGVTRPIHSIIGVESEPVANVLLEPTSKGRLLETTVDPFLLLLDRPFEGGPAPIVRVGRLDARVGDVIPQCRGDLIYLLLRGRLGLLLVVKLHPGGETDVIVLLVRIDEGRLGRLLLLLPWLLISVDEASVMTNRLGQRRCERGTVVRGDSRVDVSFHRAG